MKPLAILAVLLLAALSFQLGAQSPATQTSGAVHVACMSDGSMKIVTTPRP